MYCKNCGKEVNEKAVACINCGVPPLLEKNFCQECGTETKPNQVVKVLKIKNPRQGGFLILFLNFLIFILFFYQKPPRRKSQ